MLEAFWMKERLVWMAETSAPPRSSDKAKKSSASSEPSFAVFRSRPRHQKRPILKMPSEETKVRIFLQLFGHGVTKIAAFCGANL